MMPDVCDNPVPAVICCCGLGENLEKCQRDFAEKAVESGAAVFCFDFFGGCDNSRSGGEMTEMSVFTEMDDLRTVIRGLSDRSEINANQLFLMGESQGGFVAGAVAPEYADQIRGLLLYYPGFCIPEMAGIAYESEDEVPDRFTVAGWEVGKKYFQGIFGYPVYQVIRGYRGPVLIFHGENDEIVDVSYSMRAANVYENAKLITLPWEGHGFSPAGNRKAAEFSCRFIREHCFNRG